MKEIRYVVMCLLISTSLSVIFTTLCLLTKHIYPVQEWPAWSWENSTAPIPSFRHITAPRNFCTPSSTSISLIAGVVTSADHFDQRSAIRETWGAALGKTGFKVLFLLGESKGQDLQGRILEEHSINGDILQGDFTDTYGNLTYKTVMLIRWVNEFCKDVKFVLKIDDDVFLSVWDLVDVLRNVSGVKRAMWGRLYHRFGPDRNSTSKWYASEKSFAPDIYPDFLSGTAYLISADSIAVLAQATYELPFYALEDVYLTGFIGERLGIRRQKMDGFFSIKKRFLRPCAVPRFVTSHMWKPKDLRAAWNNALSHFNESLCKGLDEA